MKLQSARHKAVLLATVLSHDYKGQAVPARAVSDFPGGNPHVHPCMTDEAAGPRSRLLLAFEVSVGNPPFNERMTADGSLTCGNLPNAAHALICRPAASSPCCAHRHCLHVHVACVVESEILHFQKLVQVPADLINKGGQCTGLCTFDGMDCRD